MDAHSHLSTAEVIGFLGGRVERASGRPAVVRVLRALPARQLVSSDAAVEVELDPAAMPDILASLEAEGLQCVGWYHSHPVFATQPSVRDVANQEAYQRFFSGQAFVAAIVGPYDQRMEGTSSELRWWHVEPDASAHGGGWPRQLEACSLGGEEGQPLVAAPTGERLVGELRALAGLFAGTLLRVDLGAAWRDGLTHRDKLRVSLQSRLPAEEHGLVAELLAAVDAAWA